jgi:hypothetical protein
MQMQMCGIRMVALWQRVGPSDDTHQRGYEKGLGIYCRLSHENRMPFSMMVQDGR